MRILVTLTAFLLTVPVEAATTVKLLHFSDYHSHALPFYSEGRPDQGGIARAVDYLRRHKRKGALVFAGGDMINRGAPAWSDKYQCSEWPWLNGIVDAMAFGNHDADYGFATFLECRAALHYPILSANTHGLQPYAVFAAKGKRIGVFAIAGSDFQTLVKVPEMRFGDAVAAARETVRRLRADEKADAVVLIGHQNAEADYELARAVRGIDIIFGTHSHRKQGLTRIPGTDTWFISPFQYLTYISEVDLTFSGSGLAAVNGRLARMDASIAVDQATARQVSRMQEELRRDPQYRDLFIPFATTPAAMSAGELGRYAVETMRTATGADLAISTTSSFRGALPAGPIDGELLLAALPYDNQIVVVSVPPASVEKLLELARSADGAIVVGAGSGPLVSVATTDYLANVAPLYRDLFAGAPIRSTGLRVRQELRKRLETQWPYSAYPP